jgi:hypothetical protein
MTKVGILIPPVTLLILVLAVAHTAVWKNIVDKLSYRRQAVFSAIWNTTTILGTFYLADLVTETEPPAWSEVFHYLGLYYIIGVTGKIIALAHGVAPAPPAGATTADRPADEGPNADSDTDHVAGDGEVSERSDPGQRLLDDVYDVTEPAHLTDRSLTPADSANKSGAHSSG